MLSERGMFVAEKRILAKDKEGNVIETPEQMFQRVANTLGKTKAEKQEFFDVMNKLYFLPNSPCLVNAGLPDRPQNLSACFVLPMEDSIDSIYDTMKQTALIHKCGGGCIAKGSMVVTSKGRKPIEDVQVDDLVYSVNEQTNEFGLAPVSQTHKYSPEGKRILKIKLQHNTEVVTTDWHPFGILTAEGIEWRRADELKPGDLVISGSNQKFTLDKSYWLLGLIASDGSFDNSINGERLRICKSNEQIVALAASILGINYNKSYDTRYKTNVWELATTRSSVIEMLRPFFFNGKWKCSTDVRIPKQIFSSSYAQRMSYIAGALDGDGTYNAEKGRIDYTSASIEYGHDLMALLATVGIEANYRIREYKQNNYSNLIEVQFKCIYGVIEDLIKATIRYRDKDINFNSQDGVKLPTIYRDMLGVNTKQARTKQNIFGIPMSFNGWYTNGKVTKANANHIVQNMTFFSAWTNYLLGTKKVESVTPTEAVELYDLTVKGSKTYLASTKGSPVIIHNTGFNFSKLRPRNSIVRSTKGVASGPVSFMKVYDASTGGIKQGGVRRGANIGILNIEHPDIEEFIQCKNVPGDLTNFNISVAITDKFMEAVFHDQTIQLHHPKAKPTKVKARKLWNMIVKSAHSKGDPGILFIDAINKCNPLQGKENIIEATNPCGEVPLSSNEVCCLGSVNVSAMITDTGNINYQLLHSTVVTGVKLLNRLIDKSDYPNATIEAKVKASRKIGLGVMGVADAFIKLKIPYSSGEALEYMEDIMQNILDSCVGATNDLGNKEGCFEAIDKYVPPHHIKQALARLNIPENKYKPRNATLTTIAPTGTLSMLADCSSGIEPVFYFKQKENRVDEERTYVHPLYAAFRAQYPKIHLPTYFQEAHDIPIDAHLQMQATCQQYVCNAVSKTINLPKGASVDDVEKVYREAFLLGCKGVTVYVDGSLDGQTLSRDGSTAKSSRIGHIKPLKRPEMLSGSTFEINTGFGPLFITVNNYDEKPFEILCNIGKSGASENAKAEACGRLISLALRCGISLQHIIEQISGIVGGTAQHTEYGLVTSIPDAIAKVLTNKVLKSATTFKSVGMRRCPDCDGSELHYEGACLICSTCGWKSCGN